MADLLPKKIVPPAGKADRLAEEQVNKYSDLKSKYDSIFRDDHQTISQYALPNDSDINTEKTESVSGWTDHIFDTTMIQAAQTLGAGLFNWWTPPNQPWAEFEPPKELTEGKDSDNAALDDAVQWLGKASDRAMRELGRSNFYPVKAMGDVGLSVFATDLIIADESDRGTELFNFIHCKIGTYVIEDNYKGIVDTARREFKMSYRQICQKFGDDAAPKKMADQCKGPGGPAKEFKILHCIFPREDSDRMPKRKDGANKPIASVYIAIDFKECLSIGGYDESPILCRRFAKWGTGAVWGYGPSYLALPDARQVNYVQQYLDALAELHAYPRILIPNELTGDVDLRAGGTTPKGTDPNDKPEEWATVGDYKLGLEMQEGRRQAIRDAYFVDAFKLLNSPPLMDKEMTAFEISQRQAEQMQNITAVDARAIVEFINPLMQRVFGIMYRAGKLGKAPQGLMTVTGPGKAALVAPEIVVTSRFNDTLRALKNRGVEETFKFVAPLAEGKPELWDVFDMDDSIREYARNAGMPADNLRKLKGPGSVSDIRSQRAKLMQQQRAAQIAEQLGKAAKNLGGSPDWMQNQVKDSVQGAPSNAAA